MTKIESLVRRYFRHLFPNNKVVYNIRPKWLLNVNTGKNLELDIYYPELKLAIEANGFIHKVSDAQKERDRLKKGLCEEMGIFLLSVSKPKELLSYGFMNRVKKWVGFNLAINTVPYSLKKSLSSYQPVNNKWGRKVGLALKQKNKERKYRELQDAETRSTERRMKFKENIKIN